MNDFKSLKKNFTKLPNELACDTRFSAAEIRLIFYLATFGDEIFPFPQTIMDKLGIIKRQTLDKYLKHLEEEGVISRREEDCKYGKSTKYSIHWGSKPKPAT